MPLYNRGGDNIGVLRVGRWRCFRQDVLNPGERTRPRLKGFIRLAPLREQLIIPTHVSMLICVAPTRWYDDAVDNMYKEGPATSATITASASTASWNSLGLGWMVQAPPRWHQRHFNSVYNWHLKWPEDAEVTEDYLWDADIRNYGPTAVNLEDLTTRMMDADLVVPSEYEFETEASGSREKFDIRSLAKFSAEFRDMTDREWRSVDRYNETLQELYNARGDRGETEQIPTVIADIRETLRAEEIWATDAGNLGSQSGVQQGNVDYELPFEYVAPEQMIISYWFTVRLPPVWARGHNPWTNFASWDWAEHVGDPNVLANMTPQERQAQYYSGNSASLVGFEAAGQMHRTGWSSVDAAIANRNSYLFFQGVPTTTDDFRKHQDVSHAFNSSIGDGIFSLRVDQMNRNNVPLPFASIMAGADI